ncbi:MAG: transporter substrate-binding domain-containing protein [Atopobiaceae bacterium]|jgi:signal transduction histidine kinase/CheY-like chemotaxis protein
MGKVRGLMRVFVAFALACLLFPCPAIASAPARRTVRVGITESEDVASGTSENALASFERDYLQAVAEYANWDLVYVNDTWADSLQKLRTGEIDVLADVSKTDERLTYYNFSSEPMGTEMCCLYAPSDTDLEYDDVASFDGMTVGYEEGSIAVDWLTDYGAEKGFSVKTKPYATASELYQALDSGEVDGAVNASFLGAPEHGVTIAKFSPSPIYLATSKADPALETELNDAMSKLFGANPNFNTDLYDYHYGDANALSVGYTKEERAYLATSPVVDVYVEDNWEPFEYVENGEVKGITPDVIRAIGADTGITFNFVRSSSTQAVYSDASGVTSDTAMAVSYDYTWANQHDLLVTQPYVSGSVMRVTRDSEIESKTVAVVSGGYLGNQVEKNYPSLEPVEYDTFSECMDAVGSGAADCTFLNYYQASDFRSTSAYGGFSYQPEQKITQGIALGVTKESNPVLFGILTKSLQRLSGSTIPGILSQDSVRQEALTPQVLMRRYPLEMSALIVAACAVVGIMVALAVTSAARRRKNEQLVIAKREAEDANRAKSDFLSRMSHDIRTPLNGIIGMTYLTQEMRLPAEAHENLAKIDTSSKFLLSLINDVLDMSKAESGKLELHPEPYPIEEFTAYLDAVIRPLCAEKGQRFELVMGPRDGGVVPLIDKLRASQVSFNILSNAVKYTPEGGTIVYRIEERPLPGDRISITHVISDTGIGMSEEFQRHLFEPFTQENRDDISARRGTGLGLAIVRRLVDAMGGTISVESEIGKGTTFTLRYEFDTVPAEEVEAAGDVVGDGGAKDEAGLAGKHVLLCEDHPLNQEIAKSLLEERGMAVDVAEDGREGVEAFGTSPVGGYDAILMDIRMPVMDGYEATRAIRALDRPDAKTVPVIAMTADAFADDVQKAHDAGMDAHVAKPVEPEVLYSALAKCMGERHGQGPAQGGDR